MIWSTDAVGQLQGRVKEIKLEIMQVFGHHCRTGLNTLKFHQVHFIAKNLWQFETLSMSTLLRTNITRST